MAKRKKLDDLTQLQGPPDSCSLTQPDEFSDVTLVAEGRKLYASKAILAMASPVWRQMFSADFREKTASQIPLPGKKFQDIHDLLLCLSPAVLKPISVGNCLRILPLAEEYQMERLKQQCEQWLLREIKNGQLDNNRDVQIERILLAQKYNLRKVVERCAEMLADLPASDLLKLPKYQHLEAHALLSIMKSREAKQESRIGEQNGRITELESARTKLQRAHDRLQRSLDKLQRDHDNLKSTISNAKRVTVCIKHSHLDQYSLRDVVDECAECHKNLFTYVRNLKVD